ncbi:MAG: hypothetical protein ACE367_07755 [Acidimicrobiales bacterium]
MQFPKPIRPGDVIDVRAGPCGATRRGVVVAACPNQEPPVYEVAWSDGTSTRLYASDRLVTVVEPTEPSGTGTDAIGS